VCGEMAGDPYLSLLLIGLGVRTLSMSPSLIGPVKKGIRTCSLAGLQEMAEKAMTLSSPSEIRSCVTKAVEQQFQTTSLAKNAYN